MKGQYSTLTEARLVAALLTSAAIGGGVKPEFSTDGGKTDDGYKNDQSGIFLDPNWVDAGNQPELVGDGSDRKEWMLRFQNGYYTVVGPFLDIAIGHVTPGNPPNYTYAVSKIKEESDQYDKDHPRA